MRATLATAAVLMLPLVAMQFTTEVDWNGLDFAIAGTLLFVLTSTLSVLKESGLSLSAKSMAIIGALFVFALIWVELAVELFGTPFAGS